jgi:large subunit ribosomal protein L31
MKPNIHPQKHKVLAQCVCTNEFYFYSALDTKVIHVEVCNKCHPFYTGKQQVVSTTGRVDNFNSKFTNFQDKKRKAAVAVESKTTKVKKISKAKDIVKDKAKDNKDKDTTFKGE